MSAQILPENFHLSNSGEMENDIIISPNHLELIISQSPDPIYCISIHGCILIKNQAAVELQTVTYKGKTYTPENFWLYFAKKGDYIFDNLTFELSSENKLFSFVCRYHPIHNCFNVYGRNITQQKKNEQDLSRLSLVASANDNGVVFNDAKGKILWVNDGFCKLLGYTNQEIIGKSTIDFCKGALTDADTISKITAAMGVTESFNTELIHYRKDGSWFWGRVRGQSYREGNRQEVQYFAIVEDITHEKDKEEQLKILSQIAENNINAVIITDKAGYITWVNKSFTNMTGYKPFEAIGKKPGHLLQGPDTNPKTVAYLKKQIAGGKAFNVEIYNYTKNGKPYWLRIQGQPIKNAHGELAGFFALEENITSEKEIQEQIKQSEERFRLALEKIGDNIWEHNFENGKTLFSKANNELWGYNTNESIDDGMLWWASVYPDDLPVLKQNYAQYKKGEINSHNLEYRIIHKDGTIRWVLDKGVVLERDKNGRPTRTIGTHTDITHIKLQEIELEQRVKQFKSLSENIPGVIYEYEFRKDGTEGFRYISPAIERVFGITPANFQNYLNYLHPDDHDRIKKKNENCKNTLQPFNDEALLIVPGLNPRWHAVHSSFSYVSQEGANVFTGFMKDITERKNIEQKLRANEEKYRSIIANMELGLMETDISGSISYANDGFCLMSGYPEDELIGKDPLMLFDSGHNNDLLLEKKKIRRSGGADAYETEVKDKNGDFKWWLISGGPRFNYKGDLEGSTGIYLDITEQKKLEIELIEAREQAEQLARTKEIFLANMSHEIRTPMNAIMGMSNQLSKTELAPQQKFYLDIIHSASDNLLVIINDILDLSKIEAGRLSLETIGFEPRLLLKKTMQVLVHKAEEKGLSLTNSHFDERISPILLGDPYRLNQVLLNLMSNAIKFTETGNIDILFYLEKNEPASQQIKVIVKDTGIGMEESFVEQIFEKFTQEYESTSRNFGGTGLGMSICKDLIELMGGSIDAHSKKNIGTTISFTVTLTKGAVTDLPEKLQIQVEKDFLSGKKILVADDNDMNRLVASVILQNYGAETIQAVNGRQAIDEFVSKKPDIILMDIQMPGLNGYESAQIIRKTNATVPIIALTANAIKGENEKCIAAGMNDYVSKPFKEEDLIITIAKWLGKELKVSRTPDLGKKIEERALYDLSTLKSISRGNSLFVEKMVNLFCEQTPQMMSEMIIAHDTGDLKRLSTIAHKIKPSIDNLNIIALKELIHVFEHTGKDDRYNTQLPEMLKEANRLVMLVVAMMRQEKFN